MRAADISEALEDAALEIETRAGNKLYLAAWKQAAKIIRARIPKYELPSDNVFRYCAPNGMPHIRGDVEEVVTLRTASEIEAERLAHKKKIKAI